MNQMTRQEAMAFRDRWQAVAAAEAEEHRTASLQLRWKQLNALRRLMTGLQLWERSPDKQENRVRERWSRLREDQRCVQHRISNRSRLQLLLSTAR